MTPPEHPDTWNSAEVMWDGDTASKALGIEVDELGSGRARVKMTVRPDMVNGWEVCHGGLIATLADTAFAIACNSHGEVTVAAGFQIDFIAAAKLDDVLVADAREVHRRGRSGIYDVTVRRGDTVIAEFRGRSRSLNRPIPAPGEPDASNDRENP